MPEDKSQDKSQDAPKTRQQIIEESVNSVRLKRIAEARAFVRKGREVPRVRVVPRDDETRKILKHPLRGGFRSSGSVEWPLDAFTKRRIKSGAVTVEERGEPEQRQRAPQRMATPQHGAAQRDKLP